VKVFPGCRTRTGASSAYHGQDGQQVMIGMLLGFTSDVCPTGSPISGDKPNVMIGNDQQLKGTSNKSMGTVQAYCRVWDAGKPMPRCERTSAGLGGKAI